MNSKSYFRELASPYDRSAPVDWWWGLVAVLVMLALLGLMHRLDEHGKRLEAAHDARQRALASAPAYGCGVRP